MSAPDTQVRLHYCGNCDLSTNHLSQDTTYFRFGCGHAGHRTVRICSRCGSMNAWFTPDSTSLADQKQMLEALEDYWSK